MPVESAPGAGSKFSAGASILSSLPEPERGSKTAMQGTGKFTTAVDEAQSGGSKRILLVDDSHENLELMRLLLHSFPIELHEAGNGKEAVDLFIEQSYDLIFMDIQMPVMDGYTATRMMRRHEECSGRKKTIIIALTAHSYESDIQKCLEAGCDGHIAKPFKKKTLVECLEHHLFHA
jgi:two-component system, sensor histidine kinase and response regulator